MAKLTDEMKQMIAAQQCFIASIRPDGVPNIGPKRSTRVFNDETLIFTEGTGKQTYQNVMTNGKVAVAVVDREQMDGYRFVGTATVHHCGEIYDRVAQVSIEQGRPKPKAAVTIAIEEIYSLKPGPMAGARLG